MAIVRPFKAVRPVAEKAEQVAALPYDVMNSDEAREMVVGNPYSFLHIDKAEIDLEKSIDVYDDRVYEKAKENMYKMIDDRILIQDSAPCFYIYRLTMNGRSQYGLVACASIDEYINGTIKKHELTLESKEQDRIRHVDRLNANTGPIFLAYREKESIDAIINNWTEEHQPVYDFVSEDGIGHSVWVVDCVETTGQIIKEFKQVPNLYIADGHHRNASAVKVGLKRRETNPAYDKEEEFNYYLSVIFPANQLHIMDYNRLVKDLNGFSKEEFLNILAENFEVEPYGGDDAYRPVSPHSFGMYMDKCWYIVKAREQVINKEDCVAALDVSIMQDYILTSILNIDDPRTNKRIDFVGGIRGLNELQKRVDSGKFAVAFAMYPTSMEELMTIADNDKIMPPKSTWFEPKLRSGLFIHLFENYTGER